MKKNMPELYSDPFEERSALGMHRDIHVLGARVRFQSNSEDLLRLVDSAYAGLPRHKLSRVAPQLRVRLVLTSPERKRASLGPAPLQMMSGGGMLAGAAESSSFVVVSPHERGALVVVTPRMLRFPYHTRYELIEFAVFTLASRVQQLAPLHAACVGLNGRGILLMGPSGSGKSTVALHCLLNGFDFLSEDSVFVAPQSMRATGTANFLHVRADSLSWFERSAASTLIRQSPIIRRRSGVEKFEVDLRRAKFHLAKDPLKIIGVAFLSSRSAGKGPLLRPLSQSDAQARLKREQAYGANLPQWQAFSRKLLRLGGVEILRGTNPSTTVEVLRSVLRHGIARSARSPA